MRGVVCLSLMAITLCETVAGDKLNICNEQGSALVGRGSGRVIIQEWFVLEHCDKSLLWNFDRSPFLITMALRRAKLSILGAGLAG